MSMNFCPNTSKFLWGSLKFKNNPNICFYTCGNHSPLKSLKTGYLSLYLETWCTVANCMTKSPWHYFPLLVTYSTFVPGVQNALQLPNSQLKIGLFWSIGVFARMTNKLPLETFLFSIFLVLHGNGVLLKPLWMESDFLATRL